MKNTKRFQFLAVTLVLILSTLACVINTEDTPTPAPLPATQAPLPTLTTPPNSPPQPEQPQVTPTSMSQNTIHNLAIATVRITGLKNSSGSLQPMYTGSGTILTKDGYILTNCHVADPAAMGEPDYAPDALGIEIVNTEDKPPVPTYFATLLASDPTLDLAVIKITENLDGSKVNSSKLNLPFVKIGDSDIIKLGDPLYIFGYPGIGGDTITFTTGSISGFDAMDPIGERAWFKTNATIAGGNSGGLAANARGEIVGVPTRGGTSSASAITDCRRIADTNGDGVIDDKDSCIPMGGFINAVRPVKWAMPMIQGAESGQAYQSPYGNPNTPTGPTNPPAPAGNGGFTINAFTTAVDKQNCPTDQVSVYPTGTKEILGVFKWQDIQKGDSIDVAWQYGGREVANTSLKWNLDSTGSCFLASLSNGNDAIPDGDFQVDLYVNGKTLAGSASISIGGTPKPPPTPGNSTSVQVTGKVTDANNNKPIADIYVVVLKPGIDPDQWRTNGGSDTDIYSFTQTGKDGTFVVPDLLERGQSYGAVIGNNKTGYQIVTGFFNIKADDKDVISIPIQLSK